MFFDPYHKWLGIPPKEQPPHHYRLLGLGLYESDADVIDAAANRQMAYVQSCATGKHLDESQQILNELSAARLCLLTPQKKQEYDDELRKKLGQAVLKAVPVVAPPALSASTSKASSVAAQPRKTANSSPSSKLILVSLIVVAGGLGIFVGKIVLDKLRPADSSAVVQLNDGDQNESALSNDKNSAKAASSVSSSPTPTSPLVVAPSPTSKPLASGNPIPPVSTPATPVASPVASSTSLPNVAAASIPTPTSTSSTLQAATALKSEATVLSAATATASKPPMPVSGATSQAQNTSPPPTALPTATSPAQVATAAPISTPLSMLGASPTPSASPSSSATPKQPVETDYDRLKRLRGKLRQTMNQSDNKRLAEDALELANQLRDPTTSKQAVILAFRAASKSNDEVLQARVVRRMLLFGHAISNVSIDANKFWQPAGQFKDGDILVIAATGTWNTWPDGGPEWKSDGDGTRFKAKDSFPIPGASQGTLIGKIGPLKFVVGKLAVIELDSDGKLELMNNDDIRRNDNRGSLLVSIARIR